MIQKITTRISATMTTPTHIPALKMPPTTSQPALETARITNSVSSDKFFFEIIFRTSLSLPVNANRLPFTRGRLGLHFFLS